MKIIKYIESFFSKYVDCFHVDGMQQESHYEVELGRVDSRDRDPSYQEYIKSTPGYEKVLKVLGPHLISEDRFGNLVLLVFHALPKKFLKSVLCDGWLVSGKRSFYYGRGAYFGGLPLIAGNYIRNPSGGEIINLVAVCVVNVRFPRVAKEKDIHLYKDTVPNASSTIALRSRSARDNTFLPASSCDDMDQIEHFSFEICIHESGRCPAVVATVGGYNRNEAHQTNRGMRLSQLFKGVRCARRSLLPSAPLKESDSESSDGELEPSSGFPTPATAEAKEHRLPLSAVETDAPPRAPEFFAPAVICCKDLFNPLGEAKYFSTTTSLWEHRNDNPSARERFDRAFGLTR